MTESDFLDITDIFPKNVLRDRCFVIGNGPSLNNFNLNILKNEFTIACNFILEGQNILKNDLFIPNVICTGCSHSINKKCQNFFNTELYKSTINDTVQILSVSSFINATYDTNKWTPWVENPDVIKYNTQGSYISPKIMQVLKDTVENNKNMYFINNFDNLKLTRNINTLIGNKELIKNNLKYCEKYYNVIPLMSLLVAKHLGFKRIYLIGCDGSDFDTHFYNQQMGDYTIPNESNYFYNSVYAAFKVRYDELCKENVTVITCTPSVYDFIKFVNLQNVINRNIENPIEQFDNYVKIENIIEKPQNKNKGKNENEQISYSKIKNYYNVQSLMKISE